MKRILSLLLALLIVCAFPAMCFAGRNTSDLPYVYDAVGILKQSEVDQLSAKVKKIVDTYNMDLAILIYDNLEGRTTDEQVMQLADDLYDYNGFGCGSDASGTLLLVSLDPACRMWWTSCSGKARAYYTEDNINYIDDCIWYDMSGGNYADAFGLYLDLVDELYDNGGFPINNGYTDDPQPVPQETPLGEKLGMGAGAGAVIGAIAGGISKGAATKSMKTVAKASTARNYLDRNSFRLNDVRDIFLYRSESRTKIQTSSSSSGGHPGGRSSYSSGHRSSSGRTHSGGGRRF